MTASPTPAAPIRVLVASGAPRCRSELERLVAAEPDATLVASLGSGDAVVEWLLARRADLAILDLHLGEGDRGGLEIAREVGPEAMPATIFVTGSPDAAAEAFEVAATDYLVTPLDPERFAQAFERARRRLSLERLGGLRSQLLEALGVSDPVPAGGDAAGSSADGGAPEGYLERIAIETRDRVRVLPVDEIDYIVSSGPYAELHTQDRTHLIRASMQSLERRLDPERFVRVHRSVIVRLDRIETLLKARGGEYEVTLKSGARLRVSRSRIEELERRLGVGGPGG
jgi:two-component system LytT family response regulator